jgi:hypothetical protein
MTPAHLFFIPSVFFLGFFAGGIAASFFRPASPVGVESGSGHGQTSAKALLIAFVVFATVFVATHMSPQFGGAKAISAALHGLPILDQQPSFSSDDVYQRLEAFGMAGRDMYQRFTYSSDLVFPLTLLVFLSLLAKFVAQRSVLSIQWRKALMALPFVWFASDMLENAIVFSLLSQFPTRNDALGGLVGFVTVAKFGLLLLSIAVPAVCLVVLKKGERA